MATTPHLEIECEVDSDRSDLKLAFAVHDANQNPIFASSPPDVGQPHPTLRGSYRYRARFPGPILRAQHYSITVSLYANGPGESHECSHALAFDVVETTSPVIAGESNRVGILHLSCAWQHQRDPVQCAERVTHT